LTGMGQGGFSICYPEQDSAGVNPHYRARPDNPD
jgi:hypothetical protein